MRVVPTLAVTAPLADPVLSVTTLETTLTLTHELTFPTKHKLKQR